MVRKRFFFDGWHPFFQLVFLISSSFLLATMFTLLGYVSVGPLFDVHGIDMDEMLKKIEVLPINELNAVKLVTFMQSIGFFIVSALIFGYARFPEGDFLRVRRKLKIYLLLLSILLVLVCQPAIQMLLVFNESVSFPASWASFENFFQRQQELNDNIFNTFLRNQTLSNFFINLILIALIPALGEEMFYRGCMQQLFKQWFRNPHWSIATTAFIFAGSHMQLYAFIPIFLLGVMLGYLFQWSRNLWINIAAHATFNGLMILVDYLHDSGILTFDINGDIHIPWFLVLLSVVLTLGILAAFRRVNDRKTFIY